jgi:hypothetical protein
MNKHATNSKNKKIKDVHRGIDECKTNYQPRNNFVKDENDDLLADSNNTLNRLKSYFTIY